MKSILIKIGAVLCLVGIILVTVATIYHENIYCKGLGAKFIKDYKIVKLLDETRNFEFELKIYANDNPITKIVDSHTYYLCEHFTFMRNEYKIASNNK